MRLTHSEAVELAASLGYTHVRTLAGPVPLRKWFRDADTSGLRFGLRNGKLYGRGTIGQVKAPVTGVWPLLVRTQAEPPARADAPAVREAFAGVEVTYLDDSAALIPAPEAGAVLGGERGADAATVGTTAAPLRSSTTGRIRRPVGCLLARLGVAWLEYGKE